MSTIRAGTTTTTALQTTGDTTGNIVLQPDSGVATVSATGALTVPVGTTAQRPGSPAIGMTRFNTTTSVFEYYNGTKWAQVTEAPYSVEYLVIAGGAGGGGTGPTGSGTGGGGAGGYRSSVAGEPSGGGGSSESPLTLWRTRVPT